MARAMGPRSSVEAVQRATFSSSPENICLPAPSNLQLEEREFVVDSRASMHMISKKDLNSAGLDFLTTSRSPMTVVDQRSKTTDLYPVTVSSKHIEREARETFVNQANQESQTK